MAHRHSCQAAAACDYSEVGRREPSHICPFSNRVQQLTKANHDYLTEKPLVFLLKFSREQQNIFKCRISSLVYYSQMYILLVHQSQR
jgi:hypothetical protein